MKDYCAIHGYVLLAESLALSLDSNDPINDEIYDLLCRLDFILCGLELGGRVSIEEID